MCVPRGQQALWISRVQAGRTSVALKVPLLPTRPTAATKSATSSTSLHLVVTDSDEDQGDTMIASGSVPSEQDLDAKQTDLDVVDKAGYIDEFLGDGGDSDDSDRDEKDKNSNEQNRGEDAFSGTELGAIVVTAQRIIELSNATAKKQVTTNKQKQQWWDNRKKLDTDMKDLVNNIEASVLGWRKAILIAPPLDKSIREALKEATHTLEHELMQVNSDNRTEDDTNRRPHPKLASSKSKSKFAPDTRKKRENTQSPVISSINRALLEVCLGAAPFLTDTEICEALGFITGRAIESNWVPTIRSTYEQCISVVEGKRRSSTEENTDKYLERQTLILALDGKLQRLPWESLPCLDAHSVTRVPSLLYANILYNASCRLLKSGINAKQAFYLLNADGDLAKTQECFEAQFKRRPGWQGLVGVRPTSGEYKQALAEHDLFVYCGHGSGEQYLKRDAVAQLPKCGVALLMGCSSGFLSDEGDFEPAGVANSFLVALSPSVVGNLWDVTDGELDRLTKGLLINWLDQGLPLPLALAQARKTCQFRFLVAAAAVCYGIPVSASS